jgi:2-succinyl-5-enolpyruvyl-6-hydroxy-3-cyclohexene-1-carboxylate synthase
MVLLTADRPRELHRSGANQTVDQEKLYGDAVRAYRTLPEPEADDRKLRALRTAVCRGVATATGTEPGPVHLNVPFAKPLEPTPVEGDVPEGFGEAFPLAARGRDGPYVSVTRGRPELSAHERAELVAAAEAADRGLIVAGPEAALRTEALRGLATATGFPVLADPLSGARFGSHVGADPVTVCGGYDAYVGGLDEHPDLVLRFGASPTSKPLRKYLAAAAQEGARQVVVDPAGGWREAEFAATDLVVADPTELAAGLAGRVGREPGPWRERFARLETEYWELVGDRDEQLFEGAVLRELAAGAPDPSTLFVSNSMPVRDLDRFGRPRAADLTALGNRGASGIDGVTSSALGAGSAGEEPLVLAIGDLAFYHDSNGLLAVGRCDVDATVVLINNDGGGIFHMLPIEEFDPPFTEYFRTPHSLDFRPLAETYGLEYLPTASLPAFRDAYRASLESEGTQVIEVRIDAEASHRTRERLHERVTEQLHDG